MANTPPYDASGIDAERKRDRYNREIWLGGIAILVLLLMFGFVAGNSRLQAFEPFLGLGIGLLALGVGCRLIIVSHRDAAIARSPLSASVRSLAQDSEKTKEKHSTGEWVWGGLAAASVVTVIIVALVDPPAKIAGITSLAVLLVPAFLFKHSFTEFMKDLKLENLFDRLRRWTDRKIRRRIHHGSDDR